MLWIHWRTLNCIHFNRWVVCELYLNKTFFFIKADYHNNLHILGKCKQVILSKIFWKGLFIHRLPQKHKSPSGGDWSISNRYLASPLLVQYWTHRQCSEVNTDSLSHCPQKESQDFPSALWNEIYSIRFSRESEKVA